MLQISIQSRNTTNVRHSLATTEERLLQAMHKGLERALQFAVGLAGSKYMSGPTPTMLGVRTGRLRSALASEVLAGSEGLVGRIGNNMPYAAFWEFGFKGEVNVRAHTRVSGWTSKGRELATRQPVFESLGFARSKSGKLLEVQGPARMLYQKDLRPGYVRQGLSNFKSMGQVRAHRRKINQAARPYLAPALADVDIGREITKELKSVAKGLDGNASDE
jgi:phage gpG-like protein